MLILLVVLLCGAVKVDGAAQSGCTYVDTDGSARGVYECDYPSVSLPLTYSSFSSPIPQRMKIYNVHGQLPASNPTSTFSGFSGMGTLDPDYPASLEIRCSAGGTLLLFAGTFTGMSYLQELSIINCVISSGFTSSAFSAIGSLNYFLVYGGSLATLANDAFTGLDIQKLSSVPDPKGELAMIGVTLPSTTLPQGLLYSQTNLVSVVLDNLGLTVVRADDFSQNTLLEKISLQYNAFTEISSTIFDGLDLLLSVNLMGTEWNCTCENIWIVNTANASGYEIETGYTCTTPALYEKRTGKEYYIKECEIPDPCITEGKGFRWGVECFILYNIIAYAVLLFTLIIGAIALAIVCHVRRDLITDRERLMKKRNIAWMKVQQALLHGGGGGQRPPASTAPPMRKGW
ncbi:uncharacterized protein LOC127732366 [Mytilus californianus]|uniref:uncharacterized protein LOC127732366 n=1 Tax=Mytilus californianus TaxID=6549 RepID=UPI0022458E2C|nr:uncharacterized protein LOC127732366 [Mytilus californianus]